MCNSLLHGALPKRIVNTLLRLCTSLQAVVHIVPRLLTKPSDCHKSHILHPKSQVDVVVTALPATQVDGESAIMVSTKSSTLTFQALLAALTITRSKRQRPTRPSQAIEEGMSNNCHPSGGDCCRQDIVPLGTLLMSTAFL
mmetsp:Transcript_101521/g.185943  ORF Transcript_101521/g.185943 Transcript_101521/m.185943 type:complete len:141 (-) Transcript_101521:530-952(-)